MSNDFEIMKKVCKHYTLLSVIGSNSEISLCIYFGRKLDWVCDDRERCPVINTGLEKSLSRLGD